MMIRVIYKDQTAGVIESHLLDEMIKKGRIVAYHSADRWVPVEVTTLRNDNRISEIQQHRKELQKYHSH